MSECKPTKHKFEPRWNYEGIDGNIRGGTTSMLEQIMRRDYVYDICVKCGKVVKK